MDIYMRMNADSEKDYCLAIKRDAKVKDLLNIFTQLPINLCPSYFYDTVPAGFAASMHPGYLTSVGTMLFSEYADEEKNLVNLDLEADLKDVVHEGQLVVPVWQFHTSRYIRFVTILLGWLYLDLPQHITPTPGIAPSMLFVNTVQRMFPILRDREGTTDPFDTNIWRWGFFAMHCFKIIVIYLFFRVGVFNPKSLNIFKTRHKVTNLTKDDLLSLGWTAIRRLPADDWHNTYREYLIAKHGDVLKAHKAGDLERNMGVYLDAGEGFDGLRERDPSKRKVDSKFLNKDGKFIVSDAYTRTVFEPMAEALQKRELSDEQLLARLHDYRRFGFLNGPQKLVELYEHVAAKHGF